MSNPFSYFTGLLVIVTAASLTMATAQDNSSAILNNASQNGSDLNNGSLNLSIANNRTIIETILNTTNTTKENATNNITFFMIGGDTKVRQTNSSRIHIIGKDPDTQALDRSSFMIKGYVHPIRNAAYEGLYSLNAARLSRAVEGTPHGYVTYHN
ncbi:Uncharacterised protein [uncultured archaeon]|nr:Uncharacterised protein [uncultured archaeon]